MHIKPYRTLPPIPFPGAEGVIRRSLGDLEGKSLQNVELRVFEIQPGGFTPYHTHPYAHEALILHGSGIVRQESNVDTFREGDVVSIAPYEPHSFINHTGDVLEFLLLNYVIAEALTHVHLG